MQTHTIPDDLWNHPTLALMCSYIIDRKIRQRTKILINGNVVSLKRDETLIEPGEFTTRLQIAPPDVEKILRTLTELEYLQITRKEAFLIIKLSDQILPITESESEPAPGDGKIIPITFPEFKEKYLEYVKGHKRNKTFENAKRVMEHFVKFYGNGSIHELKPIHLEEFFTFRKRNNPDITNETLRMDSRTLHGALQRAIRLEHIHSNPFDRKKVELPLCSNKKTPSITEAEFEMCMKFVDHPMLRKLFEFYVKTGFRRGEAVFLLWKNVDFEKKEIHLIDNPYYFIKNGKERDYPISDNMENILRSITPISEFVFCNDQGEPFKEDFITKHWKKIVRAAGLNDSIKLHSLRASFATWQAEKGVAPLVIQGLMGHTHFATTEKYLSIDVEEQRKALNKFKP